MRLLLCGSAAMLALAFYSQFSAGTDKMDAGVTTITGVLIDNACADKMMKKDDPETAANDHTKSCATAKACADSGYGVIKGKKFYKFDDNGNKLAKDWLAKTDKTDKLRVSVEGAVADDQIKVTSLKSAD